MTVQQVKSKIEAQAKAIEKALADKEKVENNVMQSNLWKNEQLYGKNGHYATPEPDSIHGRLNAARDNSEIETLIAETRQSLNTEYAAKEYQGIDSSLELLKFNRNQQLAVRLTGKYGDVNARSALRNEAAEQLKANSSSVPAYVMAMDNVGMYLEAERLENEYKDLNRSSGQTAILAEMYQLDNLEQAWKGNTAEQLMAAKLAKYQ